MANFEGLVRPNQSPDIGPSKKSVSTNCDETPKTVVLQFGRGKRYDIHNMSYSFATKGYMTRREVEEVRPA